MLNTLSLLQTAIRVPCDFWNAFVAEVTATAHLGGNVTEALQAIEGIK